MTIGRGQARTTDEGLTWGCFKAKDRPEARSGDNRAGVRADSGAHEVTEP